MYRSRNYAEEQRLENSLVKVASIDLGSNSTRLLIADITDGTIFSIHKEHHVTRMGDNLTNSKNISKFSEISNSQYLICLSLFDYFGQSNCYILMAFVI